MRKVGQQWCTALRRVKIFHVYVVQRHRLVVAEVNGGDGQWALAFRTFFHGTDDDMAVLVY